MASYWSDNVSQRVAYLHVFSQPVDLCVYSAGQTPRKECQNHTGELMNVYCSQCSKKVNLLNDLEARLKNLKANR